MYFAFSTGPLAQGSSLEPWRAGWQHPTRGADLSDLLGDQRSAFAGLPVEMSYSCLEVPVPAVHILVKQIENQFSDKRTSELKDSYKPHRVFSGDAWLALKQITNLVFGVLGSILNSFWAALVVLGFVCSCSLNFVCTPATERCRRFPNLKSGGKSARYTRPSSTCVEPRTMSWRRS